MDRREKEGRTMLTNCLAEGLVARILKYSDISADSDPHFRSYQKDVTDEDLQSGGAISKPQEAAR